MKKLVMLLFAIVTIAVLPLTAMAEAKNDSEKSKQEVAKIGDRTVNVQSKANMSTYESKEKSSGEFGIESTVYGDFGTSYLYWGSSGGFLQWGIDPTFIDPFEYDLVIRIYSQDTGKQVKTVLLDGYGVGSVSGQWDITGLNDGDDYAELDGGLEFVHGTAYLGDEEGQLAGATFQVD